MDYSGFTTCNPQRFGQRFVDKASVAPPDATCHVPACHLPTYIPPAYLPTYVPTYLPAYMPRGAVITCSSSAGRQP